MCLYGRDVSRFQKEESNLLVSGLFAIMLSRRNEQFKSHAQD
jgi:hypothetical protein